MIRGNTDEFYEIVEFEIRVVSPHTRLSTQNQVREYETTPTYQVV